MTNEPSNINKSDIRRVLRERMADMTDAQRHAKSLSACSLIAASPEFQSAKVVMLYLSTTMEVDTATLALRAWQQGKTVVVPKVSWDAKRMLPIEINSLCSDQLTVTGPGIREPVCRQSVAS